MICNLRHPICCGHFRQLGRTLRRILKVYPNSFFISSLSTTSVFVDEIRASWKVINCDHLLADFQGTATGHFGSGLCSRDMGSRFVSIMVYLDISSITTTSSHIAYIKHPSPISTYLNINMEYCPFQVAICALTWFWQELSRVFVTPLVTLLIYVADLLVDVDEALYLTNLLSGLDVNLLISRVRECVLSGIFPLYYPTSQRLWTSRGLWAKSLFFRSSSTSIFSTTNMSHLGT